MEFKKCSVNGTSYGEFGKGDREYIEDVADLPYVTNVDFRDRTLFTAIEDRSHGECEHIRKFVFSLAICHTIIVEKEASGELTYNASSPDELALINFARYVGVAYMGTTEEGTIEILFRGVVYTYKLLHVLEFNSTRKRMSVIVRDMNVGYEKVVLYTKGADSVIMARRDMGVDEEVMAKTNEHLKQYGNIGLRTLLVGYRVLDSEYYEEWNKK
jgi:phospholipid-transporting ATPase